MLKRNPHKCNFIGCSERKLKNGKNKKRLKKVDVTVCWRKDRRKYTQNTKFANGGKQGEFSMKKKTERIFRKSKS